MTQWVVWLPAEQAGTSPAQQPDVCVWALQPDGSLQVQQSPVAQLASLGARQVVVLVPVQQLSWHALALPTGLALRGDGRLLAVLQNLLEEQVLDEADALHVALAPDAVAGHGTVAAVCSQHWLGPWLQQLEAAGVQVLRVLPEVPADVWPQAAVCTGHAHAGWVSAVAEGLPLSLPLDAEALSASSWLPTPEQVWALPGAYADAARCWGEEHVQLLPEAQYLQAVLGTQWELAQHSLAANPAERFKRKAAAAWSQVLSAPQWRWARWACVAWAAVAVLGLNAQAWWQARSLEAKRDAVVRTVQTTFPQLRVVIDGPLQMQREINTLRQKSGQLNAGDLQPMLSAAGLALQGQGVQSADYQFGELTLRGVPAGALAQMNTRLQGSGYVAEPAGDAVRMRVQGQ